MVIGGLSEVVLTEQLFRECLMHAGDRYRYRDVGMSKSHLGCWNI